MLSEMAVADGFRGIHFTRSTPKVPHPTEVITSIRSSLSSKPYARSHIPMWKDGDKFYAADGNFVSQTLLFMCACLNMNSYA